MFGLGTSEIIIILIVVVLLFGGKRLPELGASLGKAIKNFKNSLSNNSSCCQNKKIDYDKNEIECDVIKEDKDK